MVCAPISTRPRETTDLRQLTFVGDGQAASVVTMMMGLALVTPRKQDTGETATEAA